MNKYQKALNKIVKSNCPNCNDDNGCLNCDIKHICNALAKYWVDTLQELIDNHKELEQKNEKLQKAIKLLKDELVLNIETDRAGAHKNQIIGYWLTQGDICKAYLIIEKEKYKLLKEVLEIE